VWSRILAAKNLLSNINSPVQVQLPLPSTICCHFRQLFRKNTLQDIHFSIII
jgi:hypothetical protein